MIITYQGAEFFKVQFGDTTLAFNPVSKESKLKTARFSADVALVSLPHPDMDGTEQLSYNGKEPFVIFGPGEYEVKGVFIKGYPSVSKHGGKESINTVYQVTLENMNLCFLGALAGELPKEVVEALDDVDVLFVPIGGDGVLDPAAAGKVAVSLEPKLIIPMHFDGPSSKELKQFLKEIGAEGVKPADKLTLKKKDLEGKAGEAVVLEAALS
jgi:L-ascorbate metabolism protein UlaG (beta-lactamase superfamily)